MSLRSGKEKSTELPPKRQYNRRAPVNIEPASIEAANVEPAIIEPEASFMIFITFIQV